MWRNTCCRNAQLPLRLASLRSSSRETFAGKRPHDAYLERHELSRRTLGRNPNSFQRVAVLRQQYDAVDGWNSSSPPILTAGGGTVIYTPVFYWGSAAETRLLIAARGRVSALFGAKSSSYLQNGNFVLPPSDLNDVYPSMRIRPLLEIRLRDRVSGSPF